ncbi:hypothetical protein LguiB_018239 [Lonicera macranthoides]
MAKMKIASWFCSLVSFLIFLLCCKYVSLCSASSDTLRLGDSLRNKETLVSSGGVFELWFFDTGGPSTYHYLGIWFKNDPRKTPVWVANRENPVLGNSGICTVRYDGNIVIVDIKQIAIIVNYGVVATSSNASAKILDSGNLILVMQEQEEKIIWQSFDYPTDTLLPGMKLGWFDIDTNHARMQYLVSWLSPTLPTTGSFALGLDGNHNRTRFNVWRGEFPLQHIGFWDGRSFRFFFESGSDSYNFSFVSNEKDIYITFDNKGGKNISWFTLTSTGQIDEYTMSSEGISIFSEMSGSMPDPIVVSGSIRLRPDDCEMICRANCSCIAYSSFRDDRTGCELYYGDRRDLRHIINKGKGFIYVRGHLPTNSDLKRKRRLILAFTVPGVFMTVMAIVISLLFYSRQRRRKRAIGISGREKDAARESVSLLLFQFGTNVEAISEINNGDDATKRTLLDWQQRIQIIEGIAQGLLYLHKYSRLKIIHRDLKTSNILLDGYMNPKISDFGMARIFDAESSQAKTRRVVGTYGYTSPEYVVRGVYSTKSDVFSFGVIMIEIISGRKNTTFYEAECSLNLLGYAWEMWKDGRCSGIMDPTLVEDSNVVDNDRVMVCIQVALLCIQENAKDWPTILDVVSMLSNEKMNTKLPVPKKPAFSTYSGVVDVGDDDQNEPPPPSNGETFSSVEGR